MYKKQNDDFLKFLITERFIKPWTEGDFENYKSLSSVSRLELFITSSCNQKCEYCYLCKYEDSLYPKEIREQETILKNLQIFLNFLLENKVKIYSADLFSGEIWHTDFGLKVLELIYEYLMKGLQIRQFIVASNCSFIESKQHFFKIQKYIKLYREIGSSLDFSISIDGKINEDISRQLKNGQRDEEFYDKLFSFAAYNHFGFHPMISACTIENAKENYLWFKNECKKHDLNFYNAVMFLEVRNNDWTKEKLEHYADFLKFYIDHVIDAFPDNKIDGFVEYLTGINKYNFGEHYVPFNIITQKLYAAGCSISDTLTVRLGDLSICPCHRLSYSEYNYGKFVVKDNKIVDIESNNIYMANRILMANNDLCHSECDCCIYNDFCLKGCFGCQLEEENDPFMPIESVCNMLKTKIDVTIEHFEQRGIIKKLEEIPNTDPRYLDIIKYLNFVKARKRKE